MTPRIDWDALKQFVESEVGSISYQCWKDEASFSQKVQSILSKLGKKYGAKNSFMTLDVQYLRHLQPEENGGERLRLYVYSDNSFKSRIADYNGLVKLYDREESHFCSLMIARNWGAKLRFRLVLTEGGPRTSKNFILVPCPLVHALRSVPADLHPGDCVKHFGTIAHTIRKYLEKVRESIIECCPGYSSFHDECQGQDLNCVLFKQLFGSLNLTLRVLDNPPRVIKSASNIDVVFCPLPVRLREDNAVIAVMVGVLKHSCSPDTADFFERVLTQTIQHVKLIEYEYMFAAELTRLNERKEEIRKQIEEKAVRQEDELKFRIVEVRDKHKAPDYERPEVRAMNLAIRTLKKKANQLTKRTDAAKDNSELDRVEGEVEKW